MTKLRYPSGEGWDYPKEGDPLPLCKRCDTDYFPDQHDDGICQDCHDDAGEVWCEICKCWAVGIKGETDACNGCLCKLHTETSRVTNQPEIAA